MSDLVVKPIANNITIDVDLASTEYNINLSGSDLVTSSENLIFNITKDPSSGNIALSDPNSTIQEDDEILIWKDLSLKKNNAIYDHDDIFPFNSQFRRNSSRKPKFKYFDGRPTLHFDYTSLLLLNKIKNIKTIFHVVWELHQNGDTFHVLAYSHRDLNDIGYDPNSKRSVFGRMTYPNAHYDFWQHSVPSVREYRPEDNTGETIINGQSVRYIYTQKHSSSDLTMPILTEQTLNIYSIRTNSTYQDSGVNIDIIGHDGWNNHTHFAGHIAEIILFDEILTETEIDNINSYLNAKWNVHGTPNLDDIQYKPSAEDTRIQLWLDATNILANEITPIQTSNTQEKFINYTPNANTTEHTDTIQYTVTNEAGVVSDPATITINLKHKPITQEISAVVIDNIPRFITIDYNDYDDVNNTTFIRITDICNNFGSVYNVTANDICSNIITNNMDLSSNKIFFVPSTTALGETNIIYSIIDEDQNDVSNNLKIIFQHTPVANNITVETYLDEILEFDLSGTDLDGTNFSSELVYQITKDPSYGSISKHLTSESNNYSLFKWKDKSIHNKFITNTHNNTTPKLIKYSQNNKSIVRFDGNDFYQLASDDFNNFTNKLNMFVVIKDNSNQIQTGSILSSTDQNGPPFLSIGYVNDAHIERVITTGQTSGLLYSDDDGVNWTPIINGPTGQIRGVAYGNNTWVVSGHQIHYSIDNGISWSISNSASNIFSFARTIIFDYIRGRFIMVGIPQSGKSPIAFSTDGITWTESINAKNIQSSFNGLGMYFNENKYIVVGEGSSKSHIYTDDLDDLENSQWHLINIETTHAFDVWYGNNIWISTGWYGSKIYVSTDNGVTWNGRNVPEIGEYAVGIAYNGTTWVVVGKGTGIVYSNDNGDTWHPGTGHYIGQGNNVTWTGTNFIATGNGGNPNLAYSSDGMNWHATLTNVNSYYSWGAGVYSNKITLAGTNTTKVKFTYGDDISDMWSYDNSFNLYNFVYDESTNLHEIVKNGLSLVSGEASNNQIDTTHDLFIGKNLNADIAELIIYNGSLTSQQREQINDYLNKKWDINTYNETSPDTLPVQSNLMLWLDANDSNLNFTSITYTPDITTTNLVDTIQYTVLDKDTLLSEPGTITINLKYRPEVNDSSLNIFDNNITFINLPYNHNEYNNNYDKLSVSIIDISSSNIDISLGNFYNSVSEVSLNEIEYTTSNDLSTNQIYYIPNIDLSSGSFNIQYKVVDHRGIEASGNVLVNLFYYPSLPLTNISSTEVYTGIPKTISLFANDRDNFNNTYDSNSNNKARFEISNNTSLGDISLGNISYSGSDISLNITYTQKFPQNDIITYKFIDSYGFESPLNSIDISNLTLQDITLTIDNIYDNETSILDDTSAYLPIGNSKIVYLNDINNPSGYDISINSAINYIKNTILTDYEITNSSSNISKFQASQTFIDKTIKRIVTTVNSTIQNIGQDIDIVTLNTNNIYMPTTIYSSVLTNNIDISDIDLFISNNITIENNKGFIKLTTPDNVYKFTHTIKNINYKYDIECIQVGNDILYKLYVYHKYGKYFFINNLDYIDKQDDGLIGISNSYYDNNNLLGKSNLFYDNSFSENIVDSNIQYILDGYIQPGDIVYIYGKKFVFDNDNIRCTTKYNKYDASMNQGAVSIGDPYVYPINSNIPVKLPDKKAYYRLYEQGNNYVNAYVDKASLEHKKRMMRYALKHTNNIDNIIFNGYFYKKFYINSHGNELIIDSENGKILSNNDNQSYFTITKANDRFVNNEFNNDYIKYDVTWDSQDAGKITTSFMFFNNPHIENGINIIPSSINGAIGMLVENYIPRLMELPSLTQSRYKNLYERLLLNEKIHENKPIKSKNERWIY